MKAMYKLKGKNVCDIEIGEISYFIDEFRYNTHIYYKGDLKLYISRELCWRLEYRYIIEHNKYDYVHTLYGVPVYIDEKLEFNEIRIEERNDNMNISFSTLGFGCYKKEESKLPDKVQFNKKKKATTLIFDDDVVVVKQNKNDKEDYEKAFLWAYFIKKSGLSKTKASKYIDKVMEELK